MTTVTINFPDWGLSGIHGVPAPCGRVCFHGGEKGEILGGAFFLDDPKISFKDCDYCVVRNVSL